MQISMFESSHLRRLVRKIGPVLIITSCIYGVPCYGLSSWPFRWRAVARRASMVEGFGNVRSCILPTRRISRVEVLIRRRWALWAPRSLLFTWV